jgi:hypothetical protein
MLAISGLRKKYSTSVTSKEISATAERPPTIMYRRKIFFVNFKKPKLTQKNAKNIL